MVRSENIQSPTHIFHLFYVAAWCLDHVSSLSLISSSEAAFTFARTQALVTSWIWKSRLGHLDDNTAAGWRHVMFFQLFYYIRRILHYLLFSPETPKCFVDSPPPPPPFWHWNKNISFSLVAQSNFSLEAAEVLQAVTEVRVRVCCQVTVSSENLVSLFFFQNPQWTGSVSECDGMSCSVLSCFISFSLGSGDAVAWVLLMSSSFISDFSGYSSICLKLL